MERREVFENVKEQYGTEPDYPWRDWNAVLRHNENNKWYGLVMEIEQNKVGLGGDALIDVLNVKCDPILIGSLRMQKGFHPAYHMNKDKWISIRLDGSVPAEEVKSLIAMSYEMTGPKRGRKNSHAGEDKNKSQ